MSYYDEGYQARYDGCCSSENPYPESDIGNLRWEEGWMDADYEIYCELSEDDED